MSVTVSVTSGFSACGRVRNEIFCEILRARVATVFITASYRFANVIRIHTYASQRSRAAFRDPDYDRLSCVILSTHAPSASRSRASCEADQTASPLYFFLPSFAKAPAPLAIIAFCSLSSLSISALARAFSASSSAFFF